MYAEYAAKLEAEAALVKEAAELDQKLGILLEKLRLKTDKINQFNDVL